MKYLFYIIFIASFIFIACGSANSETFLVSSQSEFDNAHSDATDGDTIVWKVGIYPDIFMDVDKSNLTIMAEVSGDTKFTGASRVLIGGSHVTLKGFQFIDGDIGTNDVIKTSGSYNNFLQLNIQDYRSYKYLVITENSQYDTVAYCNFENRLNLDDKNILSVLVDDTDPGYHVIRYCSFKNFDGTGNDLGIEPIRIGLSTQGQFISRTIVEYCYFTQCNGDGEIISNKARQNVFRYNTFEDNPVAELVLRHGDEGVVYGNFFIDNYGGIRVREGQNHVIYNNYITGSSSRSIYLQNEDSDPLDSITIAFNTIIGSAEIRLGGSGSSKPEHVTFANNIFTDPDDELFTDPTGTEKWTGNISNGTLGFTKPDGITVIDPELELNAKGFYGLSSLSPAIDGAQTDYPNLLSFPGLDIDNEVDFDLMKQSRPSDGLLKDIGCSEFPQNVIIDPIATEENTGPAYLQGVQTVNLLISVEGEGTVQLDPPSGVYAPGTEVTLTAIPSENNVFKEWSISLTGNTNPETLMMDGDKEVRAKFDPITGLDQGHLNEDQFMIFPNPFLNELEIALSKKSKTWMELELFDLSGLKLKTILKSSMPSGESRINQDFSYLPAGIYLLHLTTKDFRSDQLETQVLRIIKQ